MKFSVPDTVTVAESLKIFEASFGGEGFFKQEEVPFTVQFIEDSKRFIPFFHWELFPGGTTLERHDYLQAICNAPGDNDGEAFILGVTMASTEKMTMLRAFFFLWLTNIFTPAKYHFDASARAIFYRTVETCMKLVKEGTLKDISVFPIEEHLSDLVGSVRKELGIDVVLEAWLLYGEV